MIKATVEMRITLDGNHVTGTPDLYPTSHTPIADLYVLEPENNLRIDGTYEITTLTFKSYKSLYESEYPTDMATGQVTNLDDYAYLGLGSDPGEFHLARA